MPAKRGKKRKGTPTKEKPIKKTKKEESEDEEESESEESEPEQRTMKDHFKGKAPKSRQKYNAEAKTLQELDYDYNKELKLINTKTGGKFEFIDQTHYNLIGEMVVKYIQDKIVSDYDFEEVFIPEQPKKKGLVSNIFVSKDALKNPKKLLLIICGTGPVRAGQWARALCINDSLTTGSILPYLDIAAKEGYGVILANPNFTHIEIKRRVSARTGNGADAIVKTPISLVETPFKHIHYVFDNFIQKAKAKEIVIIAHSFGGVLASQLLDDREEELFGKGKKPEKLKAIAFTDSVHSQNERWSKRVNDFMLKNTMNWATSTKPLNTKISVKTEGCPVVSAGTQVHEETSSCCIEPLWDFIRKKTSE
eukprot:TRINITY_DN7740_c0_g1_i1.p1 TRINITY_DN7740_c0_g1~~TRINITY_DN7740_c0_g1_i1.p1  ORF type:complete len:365 (+),score=109.06 TRINITY_DN7740_c0_g1_i1:70-1164(+)